MIGLEDFAGRWRLRRVVEDAHAGVRLRLEGEAEFRPEGAGLRLTETGIWTEGPWQGLRASRVYLWDAVPVGIAVRFADGRPFHDFDPAASAPAAMHDCGPDLYRVSYDFGSWPDWRATWAVTGPRKDYRMASDHRRI